MKYIKLLFRSKKTFLKPKEKKILFFDTLNFHLFRAYLNIADVELLDIRKNVINIYVCIVILIKGKILNGKNYFLEYIRIVNPRFVISFTDNHAFLYEIKNFFPKIKILTIQNGMRNENSFMNFKDRSKNLNADLILTWGNNISKVYKKFIKTKTITIGSFKNNLIEKENYKKKNTISFISTGYEGEHNYIQISKNKKISEREYYIPEKKILPIIYEICKEKKYTLEIIGRCGQTSSEKEKSFYKNIIGNNDFVYYPKGDRTCYHVSDHSKLCINIYSAFGLEVLARGNRCCFFNVRGKYCGEDSMNCFWPGDFEKKGDFWTNESSTEEVKRIISFGLSSDESAWEKSLKNIFPDLIFFDKNNAIFKESVKKLSI